MKDHISIIVASLIVLLYVINYNSIFDYEEYLTESQVVYAEEEDLSVLEEPYIDTGVDNKLAERPSIKDLLVASGSLSDTTMNFDKPNEFEELSKEDNQKIFFFGKLDTDQEVAEIATEPGTDSSWDYWGTSVGGENTNIVSTTKTNNDTSTLQPIEVTLNEFLGSN